MRPNKENEMVKTIDRPTDHKLFIRSVIILISWKSHRFPFRIGHTISASFEETKASESWIHHHHHRDIQKLRTFFRRLSRNDERTNEKEKEELCVFQVNFNGYKSVHWNDESINYNLTIVKQQNWLKGPPSNPSFYWLHSVFQCSTLNRFRQYLLCVCVFFFALLPQFQIIWNAEIERESKFNPII